MDFTKLKLSAGLFIYHKIFIILALKKCGSF